jgi:hypothetical protein
VILTLMIRSSYIRYYQNLRMHKIWFFSRILPCCTHKYLRIGGIRDFSPNEAWLLLIDRINMVHFLQSNTYRYTFSGEYLSKL